MDRFSYHIALEIFFEFGRRIFDDPRSKNVKYCSIIYPSSSHLLTPLDDDTNFDIFFCPYSGSMPLGAPDCWLYFSHGELHAGPKFGDLVGLLNRPGLVVFDVVKDILGNSGPPISWMSSSGQQYTDSYGNQYELKYSQTGYYWDYVDRDDVYYCSPRDAITKFSSRYPNQLSLGLQQRQPPQTANTPPTPSSRLSPALSANRVVFRKGDSLECIDDTGVVGVLSVGSVYVADRDQYDSGGHQCIEVVVPKGKVYCLARQFVLSGAASPKAYGFQGASMYVKLAPAPINAPINFTIKIGTDEKPTDAREASRCECGAHSVGSRNHSSWCLLYNKER